LDAARSAQFGRAYQPGVDVVLLDLSLPDSAGFETIERLHSAVPRVPIVALTGPDGADLALDAVKRGADDCLVKGAFSPELLVRVIRYAIDRGKVREELAQARDSALESARLRAEFLANMSHEIRTPLSGVVGMTRLLKDTRLNHDQREMLEIVRSSADTLIRIVNDVLDFSKISAGKVKLEETDFDLVAAVESVVALLDGGGAAQEHRNHVLY
jgi:signal transduction histidine kinase